MDALVKFLDRALSVAAILVFTVLTVDVLLGIGSRYFLKDPYSWTEELATFLMVWLVFLGAALAYCEDAHLRIDLLVRSLHPDAQRLAYRISHAIILAFVLVVMTYGGWLLFRERWASGQMMPTLGIRKACLYAALPLNGALMTIFAIQKVIQGPLAPQEAADEREDAAL